MKDLKQLLCLFLLFFVVDSFEAPGDFGLYIELGDHFMGDASNDDIWDFIELNDLIPELEEEHAHYVSSFVDFSLKRNLM